MRALTLFALTLLTLGGCSTLDAVAAPFGPVSLNVSKDGAISVSVGQSFVTPMGDFKFGVSMTVTEAGKEYWYVIVRRTIDGEVRESMFQLDSKAGLRIESRGQVFEEFARHRVLVEVPPNTTTQVDITEIKDGEVNHKEKRIFLVPRDIIGTWSGQIAGGDKERWSNAPDEYYPGTTVRVDIYGGEIGNPVGEFSYPAWGCSGILLFSDAVLGDGGKISNLKLSHVVLDSGNEQRCGGFIKPYTSREGKTGHQGVLTVHVQEGALHVDTGLVRTPESGPSTKLQTRLSRK